VVAVARLRRKPLRLSHRREHHEEDEQREPRQPEEQRRQADQHERAEHRRARVLERREPFRVPARLRDEHHARRPERLLDGRAPVLRDRALPGRTRRVDQVHGRVEHRAELRVGLHLAGVDARAQPGEHRERLVAGTEPREERRRRELGPRVVLEGQRLDLRADRG